ncbi:cytochrome C oxidase subunit IV family protein [Pseudomonas sp. MWU13-2100]|uniref:cytochrome C oxidase subunit IV family protein n=1 Tax=Pseudomonas sp. MWU13-2100 TaxID=2935075 RepID=UPI00200F86A3|nr:cytochrome C oxidase subunit IV family protein [Pseudomonas sp. MWU13-2100]
MSARSFLLICWAALATLSLGTLLLAQGLLRWPLSLLVLLLAVAKAWLITEGFMELRHAPRLWRRLLLGWPLVLALLLGLGLGLRG